MILNGSHFVPPTEIFLAYWKFELWRREWDSNPRGSVNPLHAFQACTFGHSVISPRQRQLADILPIYTREFNSEAQTARMLKLCLRAKSAYNKRRSAGAGGGTGRRDGLKSRWTSVREGSIPSPPRKDKERVVPSPPSTKKPEPQYLAISESSFSAHSSMPPLRFLTLPKPCSARKVAALMLLLPWWQ